MRFLDTKASGIVGFVPLILGLLVALLRVLPNPLGAEVLAGMNPHPHILFLKTLWALAVITGIGCLILGGFALHEAFRCLVPRDGGKSEPSVLFPIGPCPSSDDDEMVQRIDQLASSAATQADQLDDYRGQLRRMSEILGLKVKHCQNAFKVACHFAFACLLLLALLLTQSLVASVIAASPAAGVVPS